MPTARLALVVTLIGLTPTAFGQAATFAPLATYAIGGGSTAGPYCLAVADVNGDGKPDAITAHYSSASLDVLLGSGSGSFVLQANSPATGGRAPYDMTMADVNGDGRPDALVVNTGGNTMGVLLNNGSGNFTLQATAPFTGGRPNSITVADVNGDGLPDALVTNSIANTSTLGVLLGNGAGGFTLQASTPLTGTGISATAVVVADVNGDGKPDALTANFSSGTLGVLLGNGSGGFTLQANSPSTGAGSNPTSLALADVNGDGKLDVLTTDETFDTLRLLLGDGNGGFTLQPNAPSTGASSLPWGLAVADMNGDGKLDVVTANYRASTVGILLGNGSGTFTLQPNSPSTGAGGLPARVEVADVNSDGKPDIVVANAAKNTLGVFLNTTTALSTLTALPGARATLAPNPTHAATTLTATGLPAATTQLAAVLLSPLGQQVRRLSVPTTGGAATGSVPTAGLAAGLYLLQLEAVDAQGAALGALPTQRLNVE